MTTITVNSSDPALGFSGEKAWQALVDALRAPPVILSSDPSRFVLGLHDAPDSFVVLSGNVIPAPPGGFVGYFSSVEIHQPGLEITLSDFSQFQYRNFINLVDGYQTVFTRGADLQTGSVGPDTLEGYLGTDTLAYTGPDTLLGGGGDDVLRGGAGQDILRGDDGNDSIDGGADFDDLNGNKGADTVHGDAGDDWVSGGQDNDVVYGDDGHDLVYGNLGNDTVYGNDGDDWIRGGQGNDIVDGGTGNDLIWGDRGDDTLTGGSGADQFHTFAGAGVDRVTDFNGAEGDRVIIDDRTAFTVAASGSDTVITLSTGDTVVLQGVAFANFHADWVVQA